MIIFILFPGFGISEKQWKYEIILKNKKYELKKIEFLKNLKKIGKVFKYTPKAYNYNYYSRVLRKSALYFTKYSTFYPH